MKSTEAVSVSLENEINKKSENPIRSPEHQDSMKILAEFLININKSIKITIINVQLIQH